MLNKDFPHSFSMLLIFEVGFLMEPGLHCSSFPGTKKPQNLSLGSPELGLQAHAGIVYFLVFSLGNWNSGHHVNTVSTFHTEPPHGPYKCLFKAHGTHSRRMQAPSATGSGPQQRTVCLLCQSLGRVAVIQDLNFYHKHFRMLPKLNLE